RRRSTIISPSPKLAEAGRKYIPQIRPDRNGPLMSAGFNNFSSTSCWASKTSATIAADVLSFARSHVWVKTTTRRKSTPVTHGTGALASIAAMCGSGQPSIRSPWSMASSGAGRRKSFGRLVLRGDDGRIGQKQGGELRLHRDRVGRRRNVQEQVEH